MQAGLSALKAVVAVVLLVSGSLCQRKATPVYVGCFVDFDSNRDMLGLVGIAQLGPFSVTDPTNGILARAALLTVELCCEICTYGGFRYAGMQYSSQCVCDWSYGSWGPAPESDCSMSCAGNSSQKCGAGFRNSVYENVYPPTSESRSFRKVTASAAPKLVTTAAFSGSLGWDVKTQILVECASICARTASCSSYRFNSSSGLCRLSSFATAFVNDTGDVWIAV